MIYHHIVAKSSWKAIPAQKILAKYGISLEDERNKVYVKRGTHRVLHTNFYYMSVNTSVALGSLLGGEEGVLAVLKIYKAFLGGL